MLNVTDINVYYGAIHALKGLSFHVEEGEIVSLIGANGAGKTTTMQTFSGLLRSCLLYTSATENIVPSKGPAAAGQGTVVPPQTSFACFCGIIQKMRPAA